MNLEALARGQRFIDEHEKLKVLCKEILKELTDERRIEESRQKEKGWAVDRRVPDPYRPFGKVNRAWTLDKWKERLACLS